jgi:hypothetical protein
MRREWKIGEPGAIEAMKSNAAFYDKVMVILKRRCNAPGCGYAVSALEGGGFSVPEFGAVCELCYYMHCALQHPGLKNIYYFRNLHDQWKKDNEPGEQERRRNRLGL